MVINQVRQSYNYWHHMGLSDLDSAITYTEV